ncbi:cell division protein FtsL [Thiomicrospira microaerophila]|uniref:cell division protein FtsL n=1 Tax=Thiomicrospira microaerophila TaxID=406020 RepID=UPI00200F950E|nr:cell division protein FtsL [Thiomicrospira microaerophila]UQB42632.1 cell division protein FtsL [Thiomicrospira microaerophila]
MDDKKPNQRNRFNLAGLFAFLLLCILAAMIGVTILLQHHIRHLETQNFIASQQKLELDEEWGRLMLEKNHLSSPGRVESIARERLNMQQPKPEQLVVLPVKE